MRSPTTPGFREIEPKENRSVCDPKLMGHAGVVPNIPTEVRATVPMIRLAQNAFRASNRQNKPCAKDGNLAPNPASFASGFEPSTNCPGSSF